MLNIELTWEEICDIHAALEFVNKLRDNKIQIPNGFNNDWLFASAECLPTTLKKFEELMKEVPRFDY